MLLSMLKSHHTVGHIAAVFVSNQPKHPRAGRCISPIWQIHATCPQKTESLSCTCAPMPPMPYRRQFVTLLSRAAYAEVLRPGVRARALQWAFEACFWGGVLGIEVVDQMNMFMRGRVHPSIFATSEHPRCFYCSPAALVASLLSWHTSVLTMNQELLCKMCENAALLHLDLDLVWTLRPSELRGKESLPPGQVVAMPIQQ